MRHITLAAILIAATNLQAHAENLDEHTYKNYVEIKAAILARHQMYGKLGVT